MSVLVGCGRVRPQGPANRQEPDSTALALMEMNFRLAEQADAILIDTVRASGLPFVLDNRSFWYVRLIATEGPEVKEGMHVDYSAVIRDLKTGALIEDVAEEVEVGKRLTLRAIDMAFDKMREGEAFRLLAPFYCAYGRDGRDNVPPLTNVSIELTVNNITKK